MSSVRYGSKNRSGRHRRFRLRNQLLQLTVGEPTRVGVARVAEAFRQRAAVDPILAAPPRVRRLDHVHALDLHGVASLIFGNQHFVQLLSRADADHLDLTTGRDGFSQVDHSHARNLGDKDLAAMHLLQAPNDELHAAIERNPETSHARIGDRNSAAPPLLEKHWDDASPAAHYVAVTGTGKSS